MIEKPVQQVENESEVDLERRGLFIKAGVIGGSILASLAVVSGADELLRKKITTAEKQVENEDEQTSLDEILASLNEIKAHNESVGNKIDSVSSIADTLIDIYTAIKTVDQDQEIGNINQKLDLLKQMMSDGTETQESLKTIERILTDPDIGIGELREGLIVMHDLFTADLEANTILNKGQDREIAEVRRENAVLTTKIEADHEENLRQSSEIESLQAEVSKLSAGQEEMIALMREVLGKST